MSISKIFFEYSGDTSIAGYTTKPYDLVARSITDTTDTATGLTVNLSALPSRVNNATYVAGDRHGYTQAVIQQTGLYTGTSFDIIIDGTLTGEAITNIKCWGCSLVDDAARQADFTVDGTTKTHDNRDGGLAAPVEFPVNITSFPLNITVAKNASASFGYVAIIEVEISPISSIETATSSAVPFLPETNWDYVTLGTPDTGTDIYLEYAGGTWATSDQAVWDTVSDPSSATVTIDDTLNWDIIPAPSISQTVGIYRISAAGTKDVDDTISFQTGVPADSRGSINLIGNYLLSTGNYNSIQINDVIKEWLVGEGYTGALNQMLYNYLGANGYAGTLQDRMIKWSRDV